MGMCHNWWSWFLARIWPNFVLAAALILPAGQLSAPVPVSAQQDWHGTSLTLDAKTLGQMGPGPGSTQTKLIYCADCQQNTGTCTGGGHGAVAQWLNNSWWCGIAPSSTTNFTGSYTGPINLVGTAVSKISNVCLNNNCPVEAFGPVGSCAGLGLDDTTTLQAAIAYAHAGGTTGTVTSLTLQDGDNCQASSPVDFYSIIVKASSYGNRGQFGKPIGKITYTGNPNPGGAGRQCAFFDVGGWDGIDWEGPWVYQSGATNLDGVCTANSAGTGYGANLQGIYQNGNISGFGGACFDMTNARFGGSQNGSVVTGNLFDRCPVGIRGFGGASLSTTLSVTQTLPSSTIAVTSTTGFSQRSANTLLIILGGQVVSCTGITPTTLTGCTGGSGTWPAGTVIQENGNFANITISNNQFAHNDMMIDGGTSSDSEWGGGYNIVSNNIMQATDNLAADSSSYGGIRMNGPNWWIQDNYFSMQTPGGGQSYYGVASDTWFGAYYAGANHIIANRCAAPTISGAPPLQLLPSDYVQGNDQSCGEQDTFPVNQMVGDVYVQPLGTSMPPRRLAIAGAPGSSFVAYAFQCVTKSGKAAAVGPWLSTNAAPASFSGSNFVSACWNENAVCSKYNIFIDRTGSPPTPPAFYKALNVVNGSNGNNCYSDTTGVGTAVPAGFNFNDQTGGISETNVNTTNLLTTLNLTKYGSAPTTGPGGGQCQLFVVPGTTGGTCALKSLCGTSTTPTTIMDNIGSGC